MLSDREAEVLALIARGADSQDIMDALFISSGTLKHHVAAIYRKLNVRDRLQAALLYHGLPIDFRE